MQPLYPQDGSPLFFIQTLVWAWAGCIVILTFSILRATFHPFEFDSHDHLALVRDIFYLGFFIVSNLCAIAQLFSLTGMVVFHMYLVSHNMTHIEYNCCKGMAASCQFDRGLFFNLREVFGKVYFVLIFAPYYIPPDKLEGDNYNPVVGGPEVDEVRINEWRERRNKKRCGGMGDLCTAPCQAFS